MRRNYKSKFNELTPAGWVVVGGFAMMVGLIVIVLVLVVRSL